MNTITGYKLVNHQTGAERTYKTRRAARTQQDRQDAKYGAIRTHIELIFNKEV